MPACCFGIHFVVPGLCRCHVYLLHLYPGSKCWLLACCVFDTCSVGQPLLLINSNVHAAQNPLHCCKWTIKDLSVYSRVTYQTPWFVFIYKENEITAGLANFERVIEKPMILATAAFS